MVFVTPVLLWHKSKPIFNFGKVFGYFEQKLQNENFGDIKMLRFLLKLKKIILLFFEVEMLWD